MPSSDKKPISERMRKLLGLARKSQNQQHPPPLLRARSLAHYDATSPITSRLSFTRTRGQRFEYPGIRERVKLWLRDAFTHTTPTPPINMYRSVRGRPGTPMDFQLPMEEDQPDANGLYPLRRVHAHSYCARRMEEENADLLMMSSSQAQPPHHQRVYDTLEEFPDEVIPRLSLGPPRWPINVKTARKGALARRCRFH